MAAALTGAAIVQAQRLPVGSIDFYGLVHVAESEARGALVVKAGDTLAPPDDGQPTAIRESVRRLERLPGVRSARVEIVCCSAGALMLYVGIEERGTPGTSFRHPPGGDVRLPAEVVRAGRTFEEAFQAAIMRGDFVEDDTEGHALMHDPAARAAQRRFVDLAARHLDALRTVLRTSSDAGQRALAAQVLAYTADKQSIVPDLVAAIDDPASEVRNNAMRALAVFTERRPEPGRPGIVVPFEPFVRMLRSPVWTDRNKAALAVMELTEGRDPARLAALQAEALQPLIDMARWTSEGHAMPGLLILARMAGLSDDEAHAAWLRGDRERIIGMMARRIGG